MRLKRPILWTIGTLAVLIVSALAYYHFILDGEGRPFCHKQIMFGFMNSMNDSGANSTKGPKTFPNVKGVGRDSLITISNDMANMNWAKDYNYVPGLQEDDPGDLVLMYVNRPTRWTWHGSPPTIFKDKAWIIVPLDFTLGDRPQTGPGEDSERVSEGEFSRRLKCTVDFVRTNNRPNWQTVVAEHSKFLDSIEHTTP